MTRCLDCTTLIPHGSRCRACQRKESARRSAQRGGWGIQKQRERILERDMFMCRKCGGRATEVDHITPLFRGGTNDDRNMQSLCHACHATKTASERRR